MFKNATIYRLANDGLPGLAAIEEALGKAQFVPCGATQQQSSGWVPPRGLKHGALAEAVGGQIILKLQVEQRMLPAAVVKRRADEIAAEIEKQTGRKPGKKQMKEVKEQAALELLPQAFTKQSATLVWIDRAARILVLDSSSQGKADEAVGLLVKTLENLAVGQLHTQTSAAVAMADWLVSGEPPEHFTVDRELELKSADEMRARVRYDRHLLDIAEVRDHITSGKVPTKLGMSWEGRVSFVLTDTMQLRKLAFLDVVFEGQKAAAKDEAFDADAAIFTGELARLLPDLVAALGGEHVIGQEAS